MFSADLGGGGTPVDPNFKQVALLLHGDGTNGAQNNAFVDSSTNNFTITRTGNVAQGTFSPFSLAEGQWSNYFDGSGDYLTTASSGTTTGDFTFEAWVYRAATTTGIVITNGSEAAGRTYMYVTSGNALGWGVFGISDFTLGGSVPINQWNHIAIVRSGSTVSGYVNGVATGTTTSYNGTVGNANGYAIGSNKSGGSVITGYISNARVVLGLAVYTSNFTPSTTPLTAISGTSLLTCQSNRFKDNSSNNLTITPYGPSATAFSPFAPSAAYSASTNGGSGYFDGSGDYLSVTNNAAFNLSSNNFTIEAWVYHTSESGIQNYYRSQIANVPSNAQGFRYVGNGQIQFFGFNGSSFVVSVLSATGVIRANEWNHVAVVRNGNNTQIYVNGVASGSPQTTSYTIGNSPTNPWIGGYQNGSELMVGYITNLRFVNGTAVYTSNFTPPTAPLTAITNTQLLLNCTNAGIIDNAGKNDIETVGNAQISTSVKKYGTGSIYFDGTGDRLVCAGSATNSLGTGNFTIEAWGYPTGTSVVRFIAGTGEVAGTWSLGVDNSSGLIKFWKSSNTLAISSSSNATMNAWNHIAVVRSGTTLTMYLNGASVGSTTDSSNYTVETVIVGDYGNLNGQPWQGYIDDLRITKGYARYTANFTPPTQAFPNV